MYTDLVTEFKERGAKVYVVTQGDRQRTKKTSVERHESVSVLRVKTGHMTKRKRPEKGLITIYKGRIFKKAVKKHFKGIKYDLILCTTPPVTQPKTIAYLKKRYKCPVYLLLMDIFPQSAVDLGMIKRRSFAYRKLRRCEKRLYKVSDYIGCMSERNLSYLCQHNPHIPPPSVELCQNSLKPAKISQIFSYNRTEVREQYGLPKDAVILFYAGSLDRPEGIEFLYKIMERLRDRDDIFFLIVTSGNEFERTATFLAEKSIKNARILRDTPAENYKLLTCSDIGLAFLSDSSISQNIPTQILTYLEAMLPVIACTDVKNDLKNIIERAGCGFWVRSGDISAFLEAAEFLIQTPSTRREMGQSGRRYFLKNFKAESGAEIILSHFAQKKPNPTGVIEHKI
jgi:glycosyltransferase involved in cell wall biosynthesis